MLLYPCSILCRQSDGEKKVMTSKMFSILLYESPLFCTNNYLKPRELFSKWLRLETSLKLHIKQQKWKKSSLSCSLVEQIEVPVCPVMCWAPRAGCTTAAWQVVRLAGAQAFHPPGAEVGGRSRSAPLLRIRVVQALLWSNLNPPPLICLMEGCLVA